MKKTILILALASYIVYSCANASQDDLIESQPLPTLVTYVDDVKTIIDNNCINCHRTPPENGANVPLLTYSQVKSAVQNNNLISKINGNGPGGLMPLGGPKLPQNLINTIEKWVTDGFQEN